MGFTLIICNVSFMELEAVATAATADASASESTAADSAMTAGSRSCSSRFTDHIIFMIHVI